MTWRLDSERLYNFIVPLLVRTRNPNFNLGCGSGVQEGAQRFLGNSFEKTVHLSHQKV